MKTILIQLDTDPLPSSFDRVVAVDAGVDKLFCYGSVTPENVIGLVHGAMFTRGPADLKNTAIFVGGSDVTAGETLLQKVIDTFFGPVHVSTMMDSNGSNTTAAAAVLALGQHVDLSASDVLVLGGTGPVGERAAQLLAREGATVRVASRSLGRAQTVCDRIAERVPGSRLAACENDSETTTNNVDAIIAAGAAGVQFLSQDIWSDIESLKVAIDLNAVPPVGIEGIEVTDKAADKTGKICYGAIGVGGFKMKIHKAAIQKLFTTNDAVLDTEAIYEIGQELLND